MNKDNQDNHERRRINLLAYMQTNPVEARKSASPAMLNLAVRVLTGELREGDYATRTVRKVAGDVLVGSVYNTVNDYARELESDHIFGEDAPWSEARSTDVRREASLRNRALLLWKEAELKLLRRQTDALEVLAGNAKRYKTDSTVDFPQNLQAFYEAMEQTLDHLKFLRDKTYDPSMENLELRMVGVMQAFKPMHMAYNKVNSIREQAGYQLH